MTSPATRLIALVALATVVVFVVGLAIAMWLVLLLATP